MRTAASQASLMSAAAMPVKSAFVSYAAETRTSVRSLHGAATQASRLTGRNFDNVGADNVEPFEAVDDLTELARRPA